MKIAFFVDAFPDLAVTFILNQVTGLLDRGHEVEIFAQHPGAAERIHPDVERYGLRRRIHYVGPPSNKLHRLIGLGTGLLAAGTRAPRLLRTLPPFRHEPEARSLRYFFAAQALAHPLDCDVVHCHFGPNGNVAAVLQSLGCFDAPILTTFHGYDVRRAVEDGSRLYAPLIERGERFLCISEYNARHLRSWGFPEGRVFRHRVGIELERFPFRSPRDDPAEIRIVSVANLVPIKGHAVALRALRTLLDRRPQLRIEFRIVGEGPERAALSALIRELCLVETVRLLGSLAQPEVLEQLRWADLFVLASLGEATPVALMEAQACGLPVLATEVGAVDEVVRRGESGLLVPPSDPHALGAALESLIDARNDWGAMAAVGRSHVESEFAMDRLIDQLEAHYRACSNARS